MQIYIIDDEPKIRRGIASTISAFKPEYPKPLIADSAESAWNDPMFLKTDLLFLDIQLPGESGLKLLEKIRLRRQDISVIIISGYAEFSFAQKALSLNVVDYLLKPIDVNRLYNLIEQVEQERLLRNPSSIWEMKKEQEELLKAHLFMEDDVPDEAFPDYLARKGVKDASFFLVNMIESRFSDTSLGENIKKFIHYINSVEVFISAPVDWLLLSSEHYAIFFLIGSRVFLDNLLPVVNTFQEEQGIHCSCSAVYDSLRYVKDALAESEEKELPLSMKDQTEYVEKLLSLKTSFHPAVEKTIDFVSSNFQRSISLSLIADNVHIHQAYLSNLFKKETGVGLNSFITDYRMFIAKKYLRETNEKISVLAGAVGFAEYPYFSHVFSKRVGTTPKKYRMTTKSVVIPIDFQKDRIID